MQTQRKETLSPLDKGPVFLRWWSRVPFLLENGPFFLPLRAYRSRLLQLKLLCTRGKLGCHCCRTMITRHCQLLINACVIKLMEKLMPACNKVFTRNFFTPGVRFKRFKKFLLLTMAKEPSCVTSAITVNGAQLCWAIFNGTNRKIVENRSWKIPPGWYDSR